MPRHEAFDHSCIGPCPAHQRREALLHLGAVYDPAWQPTLQACLARAQTESQFDWQGLWVARRGERIEAAAWVEPLADATAQLWLPAVHNEAVDALLDGIRRWVAQRGFDLCHVTLNGDQRGWESALAAQGMQKIATLEHMTASCKPGETVSQRLLMTPFGALSSPRQLATLRAVSKGSLDCPALLDALSMDTLLAGFYAQAATVTNHWYQVRCHKAPAGVLLLAPQTKTCWELQLMGLTPAWRGEGLGGELVQQAQKLAYQNGARTLKLTVDAHNTPAKRAYARAGFRRDSEQKLYAWRRQAMDD